MTCYWYNSDTLYAYSCDVGEAPRACDCGGDVDSCPLREFGRKVGFEEEDNSENNI